MSIPVPALDVPRPAAEQLRVSDTEREAVAVRLRDAATQGRLTLGEVDERHAPAYAARTRDDLRPLTADLPDRQRRPAAEPSRGGPMSEDTRPQLGLHGAVVGRLSLFMVIIWALGPARWFWPAWPMFWLPISLVVRYRRAQRATDRGHTSFEGRGRT